MANARGEITVRIRDLIRTITQKKSSKPRLPKEAVFNDELRSRLASSPYASILASAPRECKFLRKMFPAKMLLRFGRVVRPGSKALPAKVAWPEVGQKNLQGQKFFVKLQKSILEQVEKGKNYKAIFRGDCDIFDQNMAERVQIELQMYARDKFNSKWMVNLNPSPSASREWLSPVPLQCVLILRDPSASLPFCELDHKILEQHQIDSLVGPSDERDRIGVGIAKSDASVAFAVALWRYRQYLE